MNNEELLEKLDTNKIITLNKTDKTYHNLLIKILKDGVLKQNRTGIKTYSIFGPQIRFDNVGDNFPLISTKKIHLKSVIGELLWFLSGSTNKNVLREKYGTTIWDEWGNDETGEMGPIYGNQWVNWTYYKEKGSFKVGNTNQPVLVKKSINQLQKVIDKLKTSPDDRRMIVTAWHVEDIPKMALPPCHWSYQFYTSKIKNSEKRKLDIIMNIRSLDTFLGGPFNISSYAILLMMMAQEVNMIPGDLIINIGDAHIYENHLEYVYKQLQRSSKSNPTLELNKNKSFWEFTPEDFILKNYDAHSNWRNVPIAV